MELDKFDSQVSDSDSDSSTVRSDQIQDLDLTEFSSPAPKLSAEEHDAIFRSSPAFFQGRSGTGKTTVLEHRALQHEQEFRKKLLQR